jgi:mannan endo-1,4-beta-mannosidase
MTTAYYQWIGAALATGHAGIMPWQWGQLGLTENGGNRVIKYADALIGGASPDDGFAIYKNNTAVYELLV